MKIEITQLSRKIKNLREERKITQEELAKELGVSRQSVISLEQGRCLPSLPLALAFAEVFDITLENLFCLEEKINKINHMEVNPMSRDLTGWSPFRELNTVHDTIDRLFEDSFPVAIKTGVMMPTINIYEKDDQVVVEADVPGIKEEDLSIEVAEDHLTIRGERKSEEEIDEKDVYRREVSYGSFVRVIPLPTGVDKDKADAELRDGILKVVLPKAQEEQPKTTKIKVKKA